MKLAGESEVDLCIDVNPIGSFAVIIAFLLPASEVVTEYWLMRLLATLETTERGSVVR